MDYHLRLPVDAEVVTKLHSGDVVYVTGRVFTARDEAHLMMLEKKSLPFDPSVMALFHCGPLMKQKGKQWQVVSAGPTTSSRMELFENRFLERFGIRIIIGKGGMGEKTQIALKKYKAVYTSFTGGAGALAADSVEKVVDVFWLQELGMPEAVWLFEMKEFGPLVVSMDAHGESLYQREK
jgi:tartrate/fumarate subfamily iron-sulfur-dependent hydro-lyase beta chain